MLVSLVGIIALQGSWIADAYVSGEREYATHLNDALNKVNESIDKDEAILFIENHMGGMDSLLQELVIIRSDMESEEQQRMILRQNEQELAQKNIQMEWHNEISFSDSSLPHQDRILHEKSSVHVGDGRNPQITTHIEMLADSHKVKQVSSVVRQFSTERLFNGNLENRISKKELKTKIAQAMKREGLEGSFEFAVFDETKKEYMSSHTSKYFDPKKTGNFKKALFEHDRLEKGKYTLHLQVHKQDAFVWAKIRPMVVMAVVFTVLILLCFGYSLYFIFRQKKIHQVKNDFINNMTHELKTPLASISLAASSIRHPQIIAQPQEVRRLADIISDEERKMHRHIEQVLEIAQIDRGEFELHLQPCNLVDILERSFQTIRLALEQVGGHLEWDQEVREALLETDELHLTNVFTNILDNSIKYRKEKLKINVRLRTHGEGYKIEFEDNGIGMRPPEIAQAFEQFYRAEVGNIHNRKGFGLGLSYVKRIVELHHGEVRIDSEYQKGTRVTVYIPKAE